MLESPNKNTPDVILLAYFFCSACLLLGFIFYPVISTPFAFHDDWYYFEHDRQNHPERHPQYYFLIMIGRWLAAEMTVKLGSIIHTLQDLSWIRGFSTLLVCFCVAGLSLWIYRQGVGKILAFLTSICIFLLPGLPLAISWSTSAHQPFTYLLAIIAGWLLSKPPPALSIIKYKPVKTLLPVFFSFFILIASMFCYQSIAFFFLIFAFIQVMFSNKENWPLAQKKCFRDITVLGIACITYYLIQRLWVAPHYSDIVGPGMLSALKGSIYEFKLISISQIPSKISFLINNLSYPALNLWAYNYNFHLWVPILVVALIIAGVFTALNKHFHATPFHQRRSFAISYLLPKALILIILLLASNGPNLLARGGSDSLRTTLIYSAFTLIIIVWSLKHLLSAIFPKNINKCMQVALSCLAFIAGFIAFHNTSQSANLYYQEIQFIEKKLIPNLNKDLVVRVILPNRKKEDFNQAGEINYPGTIHPSDIGGMVKSIMIPRGIWKDPRKHEVLRSSTGEPHIKSNNLLTIDMNEFFDSYYSFPPHPVKIEIIEKNYLGREIFFLKNPHTNMYFAVPIGQYDYENKTCFSQGCTGFFQGSTKEEVMKQIQASYPFSKEELERQEPNKSFSGSLGEKIKKFTEISFEKHTQSTTIQ